MKTLLIMRHGKSSWKHEDLADHERPLKKRGRRDAVRMGLWIASRGLIPERVLTSSAVRARRTAELMAESCGYEGAIDVHDSLYFQGGAAYLDVLAALSPDVGIALVVGHNPSVEELLFTLTARGEAMPTAATAHVQLGGESWAELASPARGKLEALWRPKELPRGW